MEQGPSVSGGSLELAKGAAVDYYCAGHKTTQQRPSRIPSHQAHSGRAAESIKSLELELAKFVVENNGLQEKMEGLKSQVSCCLVGGSGMQSMAFTVLGRCIGRHSLSNSHGVSGRERGAAVMHGVWKALERPFADLCMFWGEGIGCRQKNCLDGHNAAWGISGPVACSGPNFQSAFC